MSTVPCTCAGNPDCDRCGGRGEYTPFIPIKPAIRPAQVRSANMVSVPLGRRVRQPAPSTSPARPLSRTPPKKLLSPNELFARIELLAQKVLGKRGVRNNAKTPSQRRRLLNLLEHALVHPKRPDWFKTGVVEAAIAKLKRTGAA